MSPSAKLMQSHVHFVIEYDQNDVVRLSMMVQVFYHTITRCNTELKI